MENNLDLLINKPQELTLCKKKIIIEDMVAGKALKAVELYQKANTIILKSLDKTKDAKKVLMKTSVMKKYQNAMIDVCIYIIKPKFSFKNIFQHFKYSFLTKKWLYNNVRLADMDITNTYLVEIIYPENKIVVPYDFSGLVLLSIYDQYGLEYSSELLELESQHLGLRKAKVYSFEDIDQI